MKVKMDNDFEDLLNYLIAYQSNGEIPIKNIATKEKPVDFLFRMNKSGNERVVIVNFWVITDEEFEKLVGVM